jgi:hypothetical protein
MSRHDPSKAAPAQIDYRGWVTRPFDPLSRPRIDTDGLCYNNALEKGRNAMHVQAPNNFWGRQSLRRDMDETEDRSKIATPLSGHYDFPGPVMRTLPVPRQFH